MLVVDVGANVGEFSLDILRNSQVTKVIAIEPNLNLVNNELQSIVEKYSARFKVINKAITRHEGNVKLFSSGINNGQLASLFQINKEANWNPYIKNKIEMQTMNDFQVVESISVTNLIKQNRIKEVDFLKIDTQGSDLEILEDFLKCIDIKVAVVEVDVGQSSYLGSRNSIQDLFKIISENEYKCISIFPNNSNLTEYNVFIGRDFVEAISIIKNLEIYKNRIFSKFQKVEGVGVSLNEKELLSTLINKILIGLKHPVKSFLSVIYKIVR